MRDTSRRGWQSWRVKLAEPSAASTPEYRLAHSRLSTPAAPVVVQSVEEPGPDGIRHGLVARIRAEIEAGAYDTEERWQLAEERLFARLEASR